MATSIPAGVGEPDDDELENGVFHETQGIKGDAPSPTISRLLFCLRNRCIRGTCVIFPCLTFLVVFWSLPSTTGTTTRHAFLILAVIPLAIYTILAIYTVILVYYTQVTLDNINARAAHHYLRTKNQQSRIAVTTGEKQRSSNFPGRFALFLHAAKSGDVRTAQLCLGNEQNIDEVDHLGRTALHWAALSGSDEVLSLLLRNGASIDQKDTLDGLAALHYAAFYGHIKTTRLLVVAGASMTLVDNRKLNPLQLTEMASLKLASVQPTHQMIIKYLRGAMKDEVTPPLEHIAGLTVLQLVERQAKNLPQADE